MRGILALLISAASVLTPLVSHADQYCPNGVREYEFSGIQNNSGQNGASIYTCVIGTYYTVTELPGCFVPSGTTNGSTTMQTPVFVEQSASRVEFNQSRVSNSSGNHVGNDRLVASPGRCREDPPCVADIFRDASFTDGVFGGTICKDGCAHEPRRTIGTFLAVSGGPAPSQYAVRSTGVACTGDTAGVTLGATFEEEDYSDPPPNKVDCIEGSTERACLSEQDGCGYTNGEQICADVEVPEGCVEVDGQQVCQQQKAECQEVNGVESCFGNRPGSICTLQNGAAVCTGGRLTEDRPCVTTSSGSIVCLSSAPASVKPDTGTPGQPANPDAVVPLKDEDTQTDGQRKEAEVYSAGTVASSSNYGDGEGEGGEAGGETGGEETGGETGGGGSCDPETEECGDGAGGGGFSADCGDEPTCENEDSIYCAILRQQWKDTCRTYYVEQGLDGTELVEGWYDGEGKPALTSGESAAVDSIRDEIDLTDWIQTLFPQQQQYSCPAPLTAPVMGDTWTFDLEPICTFFGYMSIFVVLTSTLGAIRLAFKGD